MKALIVAAVCCACVGGASGEVTIKGQAQGFGISLVDLNPGDGIAPSLTFNSGNAWGAASIQPPNAGQEHRSAVFPVFGVGSTALSVPPFSSAVSVVGDGTLPSLGMTAQVSTSLDASDAFFHLAALTANSAMFTLAPHTRVEVSMEAFASISGLYSLAVPIRSFQTTVSMMLSGPDGYVLPELHINTGSVTTAEFDLHETRVLTATMINATDTAVPIGLYARIDVIGFSSPAPDAPSSLLMVAGLVLCIPSALRKAGPLSNRWPRFRLSEA